MKVFWFIGLFVMQNSLASEDNLDYCSQQLVQASISCLGADTLESCISDALEQADCAVEILAQEDVNVCNETCSPDIVTN